MKIYGCDFALEQQQAKKNNGLKQFLCDNNNCFSVFSDKKSVIDFDKILNCIYANIAFTTEMQFNNRLSFLDKHLKNLGDRWIAFLVDNSGLI